MKKLFAGNGNPPPKDQKNPKREPVETFGDGGETPIPDDDAGNGNPPPKGNG